MTYGIGAILPQPVLDLMAAKSIDEFQTNQQTMIEELGPRPETLGDDLLPQPFQGDDMSVQMFYDQFCIWKAKMGAVNSDDEWYVVDFLYGLKMNLMVKVLQHRGIRKVSDAFSWAKIEEMLSWEENSGHNDADEVFDEMPHPEAEYIDELPTAEDVGNENSDEIMVQIEEDSGKDVSPTADDKVLDELSLPAFIETANYKVLESGEDTDSLQNSMAEPALKFYKSPKPTLTFSKELVEIVEGSFLTNQKDFKVACKAFDEMPLLFSVMPYGEINGDRNSITPLDCVPRVFDPGTSISLQNVGVVMIGRISSTNNDTISLFNPGCCFHHLIGLENRAVNNNDIKSQLSMLDCDLNDSIGLKQYWDKMPSTSFAECCVGKAFKLILDPSGLNVLHCDRDELCRTDLCSRHKNNQEYSAFGECKNVFYFTCYAALLLFDPGESYFLLRAWNWTGNFEDRKEQQGHNMMRENDKHVLFSFDPGGVSWPSSGYLVSNLKCLVSESKLVPYSFNNASSLFISYGFIAIVIFPSTCDANGDRPIALHSTWDNNRNKLALLHNLLRTQPANLFSVALVKIKTGILLFVFDPGGSLPLQMDCDALKLLVADEPNFSFNRDYTINMDEIISKEVEDTYSQVQHVFTKALKSLDIGFLKVEIDDVGNIITNINWLVVPPLIKLGQVLIFELHRHEDEAGCGQPALVVLSPSSTIEMSLVQVVPKIVVVSSDCPYKHLSMLISAIIPNVSSTYSQRASIWMLSNFSKVSQVTRWCARHLFKALGETALRTSLLRFASVQLVVCVMLKDGFRKTEVFLIIVWDPGLLANLVYILEDKDDFERAGKRILMEVIRDVQNNRIFIGWCQMVGYFRLGCDYAKEGDLQQIEQYGEKLAEVYVGVDDGISHEVMDDIEDIGSTPDTPAFFSIDLEHYIWDPGSFISVLQAFWKDYGVNFHFTTLRTRWFSRGRICHDIAPFK